ncbi:MAG: hypothetical protein ACRYFS_04950 [Janthinobacterium lividum]
MGPLLVSASNPKFGDFQSNVCLPLAKTLQLSPHTGIGCGEVRRPKP